MKRSQSKKQFWPFHCQELGKNSFPHDYCFVVDYHSLANKKQAYNFLYKLAKKVEQNNKKKYQNNGFVIKSSPLEDELKFYIFRTRKG